MNESRKKIIAGNWKMNGTLASLKQMEILKSTLRSVQCEVLICPPATLLTESLKIVKGSQIDIGAQNCHYKAAGAYTGEISAGMLSDLGVKTVILGHSERRSNHNESSALINQKSTISHKHDVRTIICVGETEDERSNGFTQQIVSEQLTKSLPASASDVNTIIAYEPIWAIGTGKIPSLKEIFDVHKILRGQLEILLEQHLAKRIRIVYGGSVNNQNCSEIFSIEGVDGALVGGASLLASEFSNIVKAA